MDQMAEIEISCEEGIEDPLNFIFRALPDDLLDTIKVEKTTLSGGMAREPITTAAILTLSGTVLVALVPLIERWMETGRQKGVLTVVAKLAEKDIEAARLLAEFDARHTDALWNYRAKIKRTP